MRIFVPKEVDSGETRVPILPGTAAKLVQLGVQVEVQTRLGISVGYSDEDYKTAGSTISGHRESSLSSADMIARLRKPPLEEIKFLRQGSIHISLLDPFNEKVLIHELLSAKVSAISLELIPRITLAQKMDVLSSQANLAGYVAVILAAERLKKIFPMMMTPAGTIAPTRVFIIGAGVAGLQAIATAKRLGAMVEAFDTRPVVEEQVKSVGAKFVKVDLGETGQTKDGYAKALSSDQLQKQREVMAKHCAQSDVVITTAQVFGKKAPLIITTDMVKTMKPGSIIIDMAVETGGNVECSKAGSEVDVNGVLVVGLTNLPGHVSVHASQMFSNNIGNFIEHFWNKETNSFNLNLEDEIIKGCLVTHDGKIHSEMLKNLYA